MLLSRPFFVVFIVFVISACSSLTAEKTATDIPVPELDSSPFSTLPPILTQEQIFVLTQQQKQQFLDDFYSPVNANIREDERLFNYLAGILSGFDFRGETLVASEALAKGQGNCMSLAIITTALARLVGLEVSYQQVNTIPIYNQQNKVLTISGHVRTKIFAPDFKLEKNQFVITRPGTVIDYFPGSGDFFGGKVAVQDFIAKFYQNHAAEALLNQQYAEAFAWIEAALAISPENAETINMLAVLYGHVERDEQSKAWYQYALDKQLSSVNLYSNYRNFALRHGDLQLAKALEQQLDLTEDTNPYQWLKLGHEFFAKGDNTTAAKHYKKVIQLAPYLEDGYFSLAKSYYLSGQLNKAAAAMQKAIEVSYTPQNRRLYYSKLATLSASLQQDEIFSH